MKKDQRFLLTSLRCDGQCGGRPVCFHFSSFLLFAHHQLVTLDQYDGHGLNDDDNDGYRKSIFNPISHRLVWKVVTAAIVDRCFTHKFVTFLLLVPSWEHLLHLWLGAYNICHIIIDQLRFILFQLDCSFGRVWEEQGWRNTELSAMLWKLSWMWVSSHLFCSSDILDVSFISPFRSSDKSSERYNAYVYTY